MNDVPSQTPEDYADDRMQWFQELVTEAIARRTSDIHIDPGRAGSTIRLRVDGMLKELDTFEHELHNSVVSQIKVLCDMDIANTHLPQDGQFEHVVDGHIHYIRVSTFPTIHGEAVVMRILNRKDSLMGLDNLGFDAKQLEDLRSIIEKPFGMVLATGPSGSGKSTILNSILNHLNTPANNIITVEDPVEFQIEGVRQTQVNPYHEFGFAEALRAILRQDPDVMMIGEIRDSKTARTAVQATLSGRLFFSTFHTLDLAAIIARFIEMDVPRSVVAHAIGGVISTRLVRKICEHCKVPHDLDAHERALLGEMLPSGTMFYRGEGCAECGDDGYTGSVGIHEVVPFDDSFRAAVLEGADMLQIRNMIRQKRIKSLLESGLDKVVAGVTTPAEVIRVTGGKKE